MVDELGNIDNAISKAAELAAAEKYDIVYYPEQKDWFSMVFNLKDNALDEAVRKELGQFHFLYDGVKKATENEGVQAMLPFSFTISQ